MGERLPAWREGDAKGTILAFVDRVTTSGSAGFVPPAARIAVFDNDGTLWCERPTYPQAFFLLERLHAQAAEDPELAARPVVQALLTGDHPGLALVIDHDDEEREYAYPGASFTDPDAEPIGETARRFGWTMVSMRRDWRDVFDG